MVYHLYSSLTSDLALSMRMGVYTLTIPAEPQYNGTVVECLAIFFDGSPTEVTPIATILFTTTNSPTTLPGHIYYLMDLTRKMIIIMRGEPSLVVSGITI